VLGQIVWFQDLEIFVAFLRSSPVNVRIDESEEVFEIEAAQITTVSIILVQIHAFITYDCQPAK
jgi:hypothetical protein